MVILDAVRVVVVVGDEGRPLQDAGAGAAAETVRMETLTDGFQHAVRDSLPASGAHRQGILRRKTHQVCCFDDNGAFPFFFFFSVRRSPTRLLDYYADFYDLKKKKKNMNHVSKSVLYFLCWLAWEENIWDKSVFIDVMKCVCRNLERGLYFLINWPIHQLLEFYSAKYANGLRLLVVTTLPKIMIKINKKNN